MRFTLDHKPDTSKLIEDKNELWREVSKLIGEFHSKHPYITGIEIDGSIGTQYNNDDTYDKWLENVTLNVII